MKIVHLSTWDCKGGAAVAAYRLNDSLNDIGIDSNLFVKEKTRKSDHVIQYKPRQNSILNKFRIKLAGNRNELLKYKDRQVDRELFSNAYYVDTLGPLSQMPETDVYHLHWITNFLDIKHLFEFLKKKGKPVVWTLHDMNPFTGGCHHSDECNKYTEVCGNCPQLCSGDHKDISYKNFITKLESFSILEHDKIHITPDSNWLTSCALKSTLMKNMKVKTVHYGLDTDVFRPIDKNSAKKALGIDGKFRVITFGAASLSNRRKGFHFLVEALNSLASKFDNIFLLTYGENSNDYSIRIPFLHLGQVNDNILLSIIHNAGDIFVIPSIKEAFGQTCLEAMSCGVPAVGFAEAGGVTDMIRNNETGILAPHLNASSLAGAIENILSLQEKEYKRLSDNCRQMAIKEYALHIQAERYLSIYKSLLNSK